MIHSALYRQGGENSTEILLQHIIRKKDSKDIFIACLCTKEGESCPKKLSMCKEMIRVFRRDILSKGNEEITKAKYILNKFLEEVSGEDNLYNHPISFSGIYLFGNEAFLFAKGQQKIHMLNKFFLKPHLEVVAKGSDKDKAVVMEVIIESGVSLLIATEQFYENADADLIKGCLFMPEKSSEDKMERHLCEYGSMLEKNGGKDMAAILIRKV